MYLAAKRLKLNYRQSDISPLGTLDYYGLYANS